MFGRLAGYYLGANGSILPDTLASAQSAALGAIDYAPLLASTASAATIAAEATRLRGLLLAGAPGATAAGLTTKVEMQSHRRARRTSTPGCSRRGVPRSSVRAFEGPAVRSDSKA